MKEINTVQDYLDMPYKQKRALIEKVIKAVNKDQQELLDRYEALKPKPLLAYFLNTKK